MAKSTFHKNQKVFVKPVGTWAKIEKLIPQWVNGLDEPLKIHYDVGLGREFSDDDLAAEDKAESLIDTTANLQSWRILRRQNTCPPTDEDHPHPGTHPVVVTDEKNWGGWRVPKAEYERHPDRIEFQARIIAMAPELMELAKYLIETGNADEEATQSLAPGIKKAQHLLGSIYRTEKSVSADG